MRIGRLAGPDEPPFEWINLTEDVRLPNYMAFSIGDSADGERCKARFLTEPGRLRCTEIEAYDGEALTPELLRTFPLARLISDYVFMLAEVRVASEVDGAERWIPAGHAGEDERRLIESALEVGRRRRRLDNSHLAEVAKVYRDGMGTGAPTGAVAKHFVVSPSTAAKWVSAARNGGHLGSTRPGRAGEITIKRGKKR